MVRRIRPLSGRAHGVDPNEPITLRQVERTEQGGVDESEDRGRSPYSEREDQGHRDEMEGTRAKTSQRQPKVVEKHQWFGYQCSCQSGASSITIA